MGFNAPSYIQETALPALLADPLVRHCLIFSVVCVLYIFLWLAFGLYLHLWWPVCGSCL